MSNENRKLVVKNAGRSPDLPTGRPLRALGIDCACGAETFKAAVADTDCACESCGSHLLACCTACSGIICLGCIERAVVNDGKENAVYVSTSNLPS